MVWHIKKLAYRDCLLQGKTVGLKLPIFGEEVGCHCC